MEKFIVSARKYRPQDFASVVGQQHITTTLKNAILQNTLAHAFLFCGPRGVGKTTCARILAKTINCENLRSDGEACNTCTSCNTFNNGTSLNIHELDAASNNSVDDIRELVTQVRYAPQQGKYRIYIIDEVHMLSQAAFNAFLKTLEEPPSYAKFILATTEKHKILPTILSRCQIFDFKRITIADTVNHLLEIAGKEHINADKASLQLIAQKSEGCMRDSLSLLDKIVSFSGGKLDYNSTLEHLNLLDEDYLFRVLEALHEEDMSTALLLFDEILSKGFEGDTVLGGLAECLRNLLVCKDPNAARLLEVVEGMQDRYVATAAKMSMSFIVSSLNLVSDAEFQYKLARNKRLLVELVLIKICYLRQAIELAASGSDPSQVVAKKRAIAEPVAVKAKPITRESPVTTGGASLTIKSPSSTADKPMAKPIQSAAEVATPVGVRPVAKQVAPAVEMPPPPSARPANETPVAEAATVRKQANILQKLKAQKEKRDSERAAIVSRPPNLEELKSLWDELSEACLLDEQHSVVSSMSRARLELEGTQINVTCSTALDQRMIEKTTTELLDRAKKVFANNAITISFQMAAADEGPKELALQFLPAKERFIQMATDFPLVEELRRRLNLEIKH